MCFETDTVFLYYMLLLWYHITWNVEFLGRKVVAFIFMVVLILPAQYLSILGFVLVMCYCIMSIDRLLI